MTKENRSIASGSQSNTITLEDLFLDLYRSSVEWNPDRTPQDIEAHVVVITERINATNNLLANGKSHLLEEGASPEYMLGVAVFLAYLKQLETINPRSELYGFILKYMPRPIINYPREETETNQRLLSLFRSCFKHEQGILVYQIISKYQAFGNFFRALFQISQAFSPEAILEQFQRSLFRLGDDYCSWHVEQILKESGLCAPHANALPELIQLLHPVLKAILRRNAQDLNAALNPIAMDWFILCAIALSAHYRFPDGITVAQNILLQQLPIFPRDFYTLPSTLDDSVKPALLDCFLEIGQIHEDVSTLTFGLHPLVPNKALVEFWQTSLLEELNKDGLPQDLQRVITLLKLYLFTNANPRQRFDDMMKEKLQALSSYFYKHPQLLIEILSYFSTLELRSFDLPEFFEESLLPRFFEKFPELITGEVLQSHFSMATKKLPPISRATIIEERFQRFFDRVLPEGSMLAPLLECFKEEERFAEAIRGKINFPALEDALGQQLRETIPETATSPKKVAYGFCYNPFAENLSHNMPPMLEATSILRAMQILIMLSSEQPKSAASSSNSSGRIEKTLDLKNTLALLWVVFEHACSQFTKNPLCFFSPSYQGSVPAKDRIVEVLEGGEGESSDPSTSGITNG